MLNIRRDLPPLISDGREEQAFVAMQHSLSIAHRMASATCAKIARSITLSPRLGNARARELSASAGVSAEQSMEAAVQLFRILLTCCALAVPAHGREAAWDWVPYVNERFGFSFRYPAGLFESQRRTAGDGEVFVAGRGDGRLLVGAFENADRHNVASYMNYIRRESVLWFWRRLCASRSDLVRAVGRERSERVLREGHV